ncbi:MAG: GNAT family N-acetyltransferase [Sporichthyaceae bacterium]|nr:GNAT family N-acetyltransferase [Sporichthyaceae bacterium]
METRPLDFADLDDVIDIRSRSFGQIADTAIPGWKAIAEHDRDQFMAVYEGRRLLGVSRYHRFTQFWLGRELPMAGVAGVAVAPEERGRGVGRQMMTAMLEKIAKDGYPLSALYPATTAVYRSLGWELAGTQPTARIPTEALRSLEAPAVKLRRVGADDLPEIQEMVRRLHLANRDCGPILFPEHVWRHWMTEDEPFAYLADDGYLEYRWDGRDAMFVEYAGALSEQTTRVFWALVGTSSSVAKTVRANLGPYDPIRWLTRDVAAEVEPSPQWMLRVVDAVAAVAGRGFPTRVVLDTAVAIDDPQLAANSGGWRLQVVDGAGSLAPADDAGLSAGIGEPVRFTAAGFSALYAGVPMSSLRRSGLAAGGSDEAAAGLDAAFAAQAYCLDYF